MRGFRFEINVTADQKREKNQFRGVVLYIHTRTQLHSIYTSVDNLNACARTWTFHTVAKCSLLTSKMMCFNIHQIQKTLHKWAIKCTRRKPQCIDTVWRTPEKKKISAASFNWINGSGWMMWTCMCVHFFIFALVINGEVDRVTLVGYIVCIQCLLGRINHLDLANYMLCERVHAMKIVCHRQIRWLQTPQIYLFQVNRWLGPKVQLGFAWRTMMGRKSEIRKGQKKNRKKQTIENFLLFLTFPTLAPKSTARSMWVRLMVFMKARKKKSEANGKTLHLKSNNFLFKAIAQTSVRASSTIVSTLHRALYVYYNNKQRTQTVISCVHLIVKVF